MRKVEAYGFAGWIGTFVVSGLFLTWIYIPEAWLHAMGVTYYPHKDWALSLPAFLCVSYALSSIVYVALNLMSTPPLHSYETITDRWARRPQTCLNSEDGLGPRQRCARQESEEGAGANLGAPGRSEPPSVPYFADLDIGVVNQYMYTDECCEVTNADN